MELNQESSVPAEAALKGKTLSRNDARWDSMRDEIFRIYMEQDNTLATTKMMIEVMYNFRQS